MKLFRKFELPLTIVTVITFAILLLVAYFNSWNNPLMFGILISCFIFTGVDLLTQIKERYKDK